MNLLVKGILFVTIVGSLATILVPILIVYVHLELFSFDVGLLGFLGFIPIFLGTLFVGSVVWNFARVGEGTPAPFEPPRKLVRVGLNQRVRNPIYLGTLLVVLGETVFFGSLSLLTYALFLFVIFHLFVVYVEEPGLRRRFGAEYDEYCRRVPRWFPRLSPS